MEDMGNVTSKLLTCVAAAKTHLCTGLLALHGLAK